MSDIRIKIKSIGTDADLQQWEECMMEKPKCWNEFCYGCYREDELRAVHVVDEEQSDLNYITTLCINCIEDKKLEKLVNSAYLQVKI